ncbi:MAG: YgiQ family radical SAM protein [Endomicrobium sp.]|jgi:uncharacterized radical SAM protein YgiQ|nr:YgiQ family radical SAM protein [Endomicrobium sp.]
MFLPATKEEMLKLGWERPDITLISGDAYIDSPFIGTAVIGNWLSANGFKVAVIAQPDIHSDEIAALGEPKLFWGVSAGAMDSFVANYTALNKFRNDDDLTPGAINNRRPDRACMVYSNLIRRYFKNTKPIVLGGVEASLRRIVHYDFQDNALRRSILFDAKADAIIYGMGERATLELACALRDGNEWRGIKGLCYISKIKNESAIELPSFEECRQDPDYFSKAFKTFYDNACMNSPQILCQKHNDRYLTQNPKQPPLTPQELDAVYDLDYTREVHPSSQKYGKVKAQDTIKFSITSHRGCFGECNFCAIAVHQGKETVSRSRQSIINEVVKITKLKDFKGYISDIGGPTANMYGSHCNARRQPENHDAKTEENAVYAPAGSCINKRCLFPQMCKNLYAGHSEHLDLLKEASKVEGVKKVFISSGIRYDMICQDGDGGENYLKFISANNVSGQMKIAPEHADERILELMGKPSSSYLKRFIEMFNKNKNANQFLTYYFIAAYPGCSQKETQFLHSFIKKTLKTRPQQVQIFTPTPSTLATLMYYTGKDLNGNDIFVEKDRNAKQKQKRTLTD